MCEKYAGEYIHCLTNNKSNAPVHPLSQPAIHILFQSHSFSELNCWILQQVAGFQLHPSSFRTLNAFTLRCWGSRWSGGNNSYFSHTDVNTLLISGKSICVALATTIREWQTLLHNCIEVEVFKSSPAGARILWETASRCIKTQVCVCVNITV